MDRVLNSFNGAAADQLRNGLSQRTMSCTLPRASMGPQLISCGTTRS